MYSEFIKSSFKLLIRSKFTYLLFACVILVWLAIFTLFIQIERLQLFSPKIEPKAYFFDDRLEGGNSIITKTEFSDSTIAMKYILKKGFVTPYAGMTLSDFKSSPDFSIYNKIKIKLDGKGVENAYIHLTTKDKNVKNKLHRMANRLSEVHVTLNNNVFEKEIDLSTFETPSWWYHSINQPKNDFEKIDFKNIVSVAIVTGIPPKLDLEQTLVLKSVEFYNDYYEFKVIFFLSLVLLFISLWLYYFVKVKKSKKNSIIIEYKPITTNTDKLNSANSIILDYIHEHYNDSELSLPQVAKHAGVSERVISKYISDTFACNFSTYVNSIRIAEAERLIKNSTLSISEIAYKVGFNDPGFFTKTFKKITGRTPSGIV